MPSFHRVLVLGVLALTLAAGFGCASTENRAYARELGPLVGRAPVAWFIERYGEPEKRTAIDGRTEILQFRVAEESLAGRGTHANVVVGTELRLTFKDGILAGWQAFNVVR
jgi:hypothetical protein